MKAIDIQWDVDEDENYEMSAAEVIEMLPTEIEIPDGIDVEDVADYLSDETGFCHKGFRLVD